jgi:hypothetical protein
MDPVNDAPDDRPEHWNPGSETGERGIEGEKRQVDITVLSDVMPQLVRLHRLSTDDAHGRRDQEDAKPSHEK